MCQNRVLFYWGKEEHSKSVKNPLGENTFWTIPKHANVPSFRFSFTSECTPVPVFVLGTSAQTTLLENHPFVNPRPPEVPGVVVFQLRFLKMVLTVLLLLFVRRFCLQSLFFFLGPQNFFVEERQAAGAGFWASFGLSGVTRANRKFEWSDSCESA